MTWKTLLPVTAGLLLATMVGCRSPLDSLIRPQSPEPQGDGYSNAMPVSHTGAIVYGDGGQEIYGCPGQCEDAGRRAKWDHRWSYVPPQNLSYPAPNQPGAVVQYPYYTLKGPSDFFWDPKISR